jgi:hypothetical protein
VNCAEALACEMDCVDIAGTAGERTVSRGRKRALAGRLGLQRTVASDGIRLFGCACLRCGGEKVEDGRCGLVGRGSVWNALEASGAAGKRRLGCVRIGVRFTGRCKTQVWAAYVAA